MNMRPRCFTKPVGIRMSRVGLLAAEKATDDHLARMHETNAALAAARTIEAQIVAGMCFHKAIADATGNPVFGIVLDVLGQFLFESRRATLKQSGANAALRHHQLLLAAISERDLAKAQLAVQWKTASGRRRPI